MEMFLIPVKKFIEHMEKRRKVLVCNISTATYDRTEEPEATKKFHISLKGLDNIENRKGRYHFHYMGLYRRATHNDCKY